MNILLFGIAKDIVGKSEIQIQDQERVPSSVAELKSFMVREYPEFANLSSFAVAVNSEYAMDHVSLVQNDEIAIIPPVSGG